MALNTHQEICQLISNHAISESNIIALSKDGNFELRCIADKSGKSFLETIQLIACLELSKNSSFIKSLNAKPSERDISTLPWVLLYRIALDGSECQTIGRYDQGSPNIQIWIQLFEIEIKRVSSWFRNTEERLLIKKLDRHGARFRYYDELNELGFEVRDPKSIKKTVLRRRDGA